MNEHSTIGANTHTLQKLHRSGHMWKDCIRRNISKGEALVLKRGLLLKEIDHTAFGFRRRYVQHISNFLSSQEFAVLGCRLITNEEPRQDGRHGYARASIGGCVGQVYRRGVSVCVPAGLCGSSHHHLTVSRTSPKAAKADDKFTPIPPKHHKEECDSILVVQGWTRWKVAVASG